MYDQEIDRTRAVPSNQRLEKTHYQMVRTRNYKARNERIETGVLVKSHKGRKVSVESKVGECFQWKATGQCSRGDSCSFSNGSNRGQPAQSPSPAPKAQTEIDRRKPWKGIGSRGESPSGRKGQKGPKKILQRKVYESVVWLLAYSRTSKLQICIGMQIWRQMSIYTDGGWWAAP